MNVLVLGSKPRESYPDDKFDVVLSANGAVSLLRKYACDATTTYAVIASPQLLRHSYIQDSLQDARPSAVLLRGENSKARQLARDLSPSSDVSFVEPAKKVLERSIGVIRTRKAELEAFYKSYKLHSRSFSKQLWSAVRKSRVGPEPSTGIFTIYYALDRFPEFQRVVVSGIGLSAGGHFYGSGGYTEYRAVVDLVYSARFPSGKREKVFTTEMSLAERSSFVFIDC